MNEASATDEEPAKRPSVHQRVRRVLAVVLAILAGVLLALCVYEVSLQPGAAIVKTVFEARPEVTPPADFSAVKRSVTPGRLVKVAAQGIPTAGLTIYSPRHSSSALPIILWIHGGGFISSSASTVEDYSIILASHGYLVASLDYSLAPGARHPTPVLQANAALALLDSRAADYGADAAKIFIGGDSAGAQIASELAALQSNPDFADALNVHPALASGQLRGVVLFCGLYDMDTVAKTGFPALRTYLWAYTGSRDWTSYRDIDQMSTTRTATSAYPPTFLSVGNADPFQSQATELASHLRAKGVQVSTLWWQGSRNKLGHEYQFDFSRPQARTALSATLDFIHSQEVIP